jgi:hypothetical protein
LNARARRGFTLPCRQGGLCVLLSLIALTAVLYGETSRAGKDPALPPPLRKLSRCFQAQSADVLRELLLESGKIRASSPSLGMKPGYYSADQIYFVFQDVFRVYSTLQFRILRGTEIPPHSLRQNVLTRWTYRKGNSRELTAELSFDLVRRDGSWRIQEIREIP